MPLSALLVALICGILWAEYTVVPAATLLRPFWALVLLFLLSSRNGRSRQALLILLVFCCGALLDRFDRSVPPLSNHIAAYADGQECRLDGRVAAVTLSPPDGFNLDVDLLRIFRQGTEQAISGRLRLHVETGGLSLHPGDLIRFPARPRLPRLFGTPGEFDSPRHLALRDLHVTAFVPQGRDILLLRRAPDQLSPLAQARDATGRFIDNAISGRSRPLVRALAIGDKNGLDPQVADLLARGGVSHLFAISGLNLTFIAVGLYAAGLALCRRSERLLLFMPPQRLLPLFIAPCLVFYLFWTGAEFSTQRALVMALALSLLFLLRRRTGSYAPLLTAAFLILLAAPLALFEPSFQLSFAALFGIVFAVRRWQPTLLQLPTVTRGGVSILLASSAATIATLPLVLYNFHLLAPAGPVANLIAVPLIGWFAVPPALAGSLIWPLWPETARLLLHASSLVVDLMLEVVAFVTRLPGLSGWNVFAPTTALIALTLAIVALTLARTRPVSALTATVVALVLIALTLLPRSGLALEMISVGQGDALLVTSGRHHILVDAGGLYGQFDTGRMLVAPFLGRSGVRELDAVLQTHRHPDHTQGLASLVDLIPVRQFLSRAPVTDAALATALQKREVGLRILSPGWNNLLLESSNRVDIFVPPPAQDENEESLVLYAGDGRNGLLLTGDLGPAGVEALLDAPLPGPVTLLKLPHHGSRHSPQGHLLDVLRPQVAIVSAGRDNRFGFPAAETLAAIERAKIPLWRSDRDGSVRLRAGTDGWEGERLDRGFFIDRSVDDLLHNSLFFIYSGAGWHEFRKSADR